MKRKHPGRLHKQNPETKNNQPKNENPKLFDELHSLCSSIAILLEKMEGKVIGTTKYHQKFLYILSLFFRIAKQYEEDPKLDEVIIDLSLDFGCQVEQWRPKLLRDERIDLNRLLGAYRCYEHIVKLFDFYNRHPFLVTGHGAESRREKIGFILREYNTRYWNLPFAEARGILHSIRRLNNSYIDTKVDTIPLTHSNGIPLSSKIYRLVVKAWKQDNAIERDLLSAFRACNDFPVCDCMFHQMQKSCNVQRQTFAFDRTEIRLGSYVCKLTQINATATYPHWQQTQEFLACQLWCDLPGPILLMVSQFIGSGKLGCQIQLYIRSSSMGIPVELCVNTTGVNLRCLHRHADHVKGLLEETTGAPQKC